MIEIKLIKETLISSPKFNILHYALQTYWVGSRNQYENIDFNKHLTHMKHVELKKDLDRLSFKQTDEHLNSI